MRAIAIKCPNCAATIKAQDGASSATCEYCGTTSAVQRRTRILEIAMPVQAHAQAGGARMPVATQKHSGCWIGGLIGLVVLALGIGGLVFGVKKVAEKAGLDPTAHLKEASYDGDRALVVDDLSGDGKADIVAKARKLRPVDTVYIAAWDPRSGKRLWLSSKLGPFGDMHQLVLHRAGDLVVAAVDGPTLRAYAIVDGTQRWEIRLHEKVDDVCAGPEGKVRVLTADDKANLVALDSGAIEPADAEAPCEPLANSDEDASTPDHRVIDWSDDTLGDLVARDRIEGMRADTSLYLAASQTFIALGAKDPGTRVPMIAAYRAASAASAESEEVDLPPGADDLPPEVRRRMARAMAVQKDAPLEVLWKQAVPGGDPLAVAARDADEEKVAVADGVIAIAYEDKGGPHSLRLTAFNLDDGARLWDIKMENDSPYSGIAAGDGVVMVSRWDGLFVFDAKDGKRLEFIE